MEAWQRRHLLVPLVFLKLLIHFDCPREGGLRVERGRDRRAWRNVSLTEVILLLSLFAVLTYMATRTPPNLPIHNSLMDFPSTPQSLAPPMFGRERKDSDRRK